MSHASAPERPATFREVLACREFRTVFGAGTMSWFGDNAARAAVTALVYQRTESVSASAVTFAISYLPWIGLGSILSAIAERHPYRRVMILSDLARMVLMAVIAIPGMPVNATIALLFTSALLSPPFEAARSALLPQLLDGDRYVVGLTAQRTSAQLTLVFGYSCGATVAAYSASIAILFNAFTFGFSAFLLAVGVRERPPALAEHQRSNVLRETYQGFVLVFSTPLLRAIAIINFGVSLFTILPEGLAAGWAADLTSSPDDRGWYQGLIMTAHPVGFIIGGIVVGRFVAPPRRIRLIRPLAVAAPLALLPALFDLRIAGVVFITAACGFMVAGLNPPSNSLFVQALPDEFRARAFGVMLSGFQLLQGAGVFIGGALAEQFTVPMVIGANGVIGTAVLLAAAVSFPSLEKIDAAILATRRPKLPVAEG